MSNFARGWRLYNLMLGAGSALLATAVAASSAAAQTTAPAPAQPAAAPAQAASTPGGLTYDGITLYGTVDLGVAYLTHGAPLSATYGPGLPYMIQKFSNKPIVSVAPNGLSQSRVGVSGDEPITPDAALVFKLETGFQPTSLRITNGPASIVKSDGVPLAQQTESGDSSRAGQLFQSAAWAGISTRNWGVLTYGRQTGLVLDDLVKYDPQEQAQAFSPLGYSGVAGGGGDTEDTRFDSTLKYAWTGGPVRLALLHQFSAGGSDPGADEVDIGGDFRGLSLDGVYSHVSDAISVSALSAAQNAVNPGTLDAVVSDNTTYSVQGKYAPRQLRRLRLYGGYERIEYANPANPLSAGATGAGGYVLSDVNDTAYTIHKILVISWVGARYAVTPKVDLATAYYNYDQNSYKGNGCADTSASSCSGTMNFASAVADDRLTRMFDLYAGVSYSTVADGLASGYLNRSVVGPMAGVRFNF